MRRLAALAAIAAVLTLTGCNGSDPDWSKYSPAVKARIDGLVAAKDCSGMQTEFNNAETNKSTDLMKYLDDQMKKAGCY